MEASELIPFGGWVPDLGDFDAGGALIIKNCVPYGQKYKPFEASVETSDALASTCRGGFAYRDAAGTVTIFAGTATKLYKLSGTSWVDVTRLVGGDYSLGVDNFWRFVPFGTLIIATSYTDDMQVFDTASASNFSLLSATAPRARDIAVISNFLVAIDTVDGDGALGFRVRWSPIGNPAGVWGSIIATQTDYQDIYDSVYSNTFITPYGDYGVIVQGRAFYRMDYVGGEAIFSFAPLDRGRGSILTRSCICNGQSIFFLGEDGFYEFNGGQMIPIGDKMVDKYFQTNFDYSHDYNLNCSIDPIRKLILWAVPHIDATGGKCNKIYAFSWVDRRFSLTDEVTECLLSFLTGSYTLEGLDAVSASLDALPFSLDSRAWTGGKNVLASFSDNHKLSLFTGSARTATFGTNEVRLNPSGRALVEGVIPYIEGGTVRGRLATRNLLTQTATYTDYVSQNTYTGELDFLKDAAFHRVEVEVSGSWTIAHGVAVRQEPTARA